MSTLQTNERLISVSKEAPPPQKTMHEIIDFELRGLRQELNLLKQKVQNLEKNEREEKYLKLHPLSSEFKPAIQNNSLK